MARKSVSKLRLAAFGGAASLVAASALILLGPPVAAPAAVGDLTCLGAGGDMTFSPGVKLTSGTSQFSATGTLGACLSLSNPAITGGTFVITGTVVGDCSTGGSASGTGTATFNDPAHTTATGTLSFTAQLVAGIPVMTFSAHGTEGAFLGDTWTGLPLTAAFDPAACALPSGVTSATVSNTQLLAG
jgi:hypothetical protein